MRTIARFLLAVTFPVWALLYLLWSAAGDVLDDRWPKRRVTARGGEGSE